MIHHNFLYSLFLISSIHLGSSRSKPIIEQSTTNIAPLTVSPVRILSTCKPGQFFQRDCKLYISCENGRWKRNFCPENRFWNHIAKKCDEIHNVPACYQMWVEIQRNIKNLMHQKSSAQSSSFSSEEDRENFSQHSRTSTSKSSTSIKMLTPVTSESEATVPTTTSTISPPSSMNKDEDFDNGDEERSEDELNHESDDDNAGYDDDDDDDGGYDDQDQSSNERLSSIKIRQVNSQQSYRPYVIEKPYFTSKDYEEEDDDDDDVDSEDGDQNDYEDDSISRTKSSEDRVSNNFDRFQTENDAGSMLKKQTKRTNKQEFQAKDTEKNDDENRNYHKNNHYDDDDDEMFAIKKSNKQTTSEIDRTEEIGVGAKQIINPYGKICIVRGNHLECHDDQSTSSTKTLSTTTTISTIGKTSTESPSETNQMNVSESNDKIDHNCLDSKSHIDYHSYSFTIEIKIEDRIYQRIVTFFQSIIHFVTLKFL